MNRSLIACFKDSYLENVLIFQNMKSMEKLTSLNEHISLILHNIIINHKRVQWKFFKKMKRNHKQYKLMFLIATKPKFVCRSLEQRKVYCRAKFGAEKGLLQGRARRTGGFCSKTQTPRWFSGRSSYRQNLG